MIAEIAENITERSLGQLQDILRGLRDTSERDRYYLFWISRSNLPRVSVTRRATRKTIDSLSISESTSIQPLAKWLWVHTVAPAGVTRGVYRSLGQGITWGNSYQYNVITNSPLPRGSDDARPVTSFTSNWRRRWLNCGQWIAEMFPVKKTRSIMCLLSLVVRCKHIRQTQQFSVQHASCPWCERRADWREQRVWLMREKGVTSVLG